MNRRTARTDHGLFTPQRREPETTPDGSFVRRRFQPLRATGPRSGYEPADCSHGPRAFSPQRREPETTPEGSFVRRRFQPLRATGPRSGYEPADCSHGPRAFTPQRRERRRRLRVPSYAPDSTRCGPQARAPDMNRRTARTDRGLFSPQRREPETTPEGSFVRRRFHPLRATGPHSGGRFMGMARPSRFHSERTCSKRAAVKSSW